jgi:hypothetical protein
VPPKPRPLAERFWLKVDKQRDTDSCWLWTAARTGAGYGAFSLGRKRDGDALAHRVAYQMRYGSIPEGLTIDHLCRVRHCVNPAHLEVVSMAENLRRGYSPWAINGRKTHCKRGHEFTEENTRHYKGQRHCRKCASWHQRWRYAADPELYREKSRRYKERKRAEG